MLDPTGMSQSLSSASLRNLLGLAEKRERLQQELAKIKQEIYSKVNGSNVPKPTGKKAFTPKAKSGKKGRRGAVKEKILAALQAAGSKGIGVTELSPQLGIKSQNLHAWFATTGKTIKGFEEGCARNVCLGLLAILSSAD